MATTLAPSSHSNGGSGGGGGGRGDGGGGGGSGSPNPHWAPTAYMPYMRAHTTHGWSRIHTTLAQVFRRILESFVAVCGCSLKMLRWRLEHQKHEVEVEVEVEIEAMHPEFEFFEDWNEAGDDACDANVAPEDFEDVEVDLEDEEMVLASASSSKRTNDSWLFDGVIGG